MIQKDMLRIVLLLIILASIFAIFLSALKISRGFTLITGSAAQENPAASSTSAILGAILVFVLVLIASVTILSRLNRNLR